jgi:hypothetical protein
LVTGITELARNIIEHSTEKRGAITLRLYDHEQFRELVDLAEDDLGSESSQLNNANVVFDINVFDLGTKGVAESLFEFVQSWAAEETDVGLKASLESDRDRLDNTETCLQDLLDPEAGVQLDHQAKRAVAHLGLQVFSSIVSDNNGVVRASTWKKGSPRTRETSTVPSVPAQVADHRLVDMGTNYNVLLPVDAHREYGIKLPGNFPIFTEATQIGIQQIESLFDVAVEKNGVREPRLGCGNQPQTISIFDVPSRPIENRDDEAIWWNEVRRAIPVSFHDAAFRVLDMDGAKLSASQLFRFLGRFELEFPHDHLILSNLSNDLFLELKSINDEFVKRAQIRNHAFPFWNLNAVTLIYSSVHRTVSGEDQHFHLVDAMWGETVTHFVGINKVIRNTNFNSISLLRSEQEDLKGDRDELADLHARLRRFNIFENGMSLLPFDLLLTDSDGVSLFEHNARFLLGNELKID